MSQTDFFAHLLLAVLPLWMAWGIGREALPGLLTRFRQTRASRQVIFRPVVAQVQVSLLGEFIAAAIAVIFGSMLAEWFVVTFLPSLATAAEYPAAPPVLLSLIVMIASALVAYVFWGLVAFVNARVHPFIREVLEPPKH